MTRRTILAVTFDGQEYADNLATALTLKEGHTNVKVYREKIRAESTWRWGWVLVADAPEVGRV